MFSLRDLQKFGKNPPIKKNKDVKQTIKSIIGITKGAKNSIRLENMLDDVRNDIVLFANV
jgi:uncharacterized protein YpbB